ncbi:MAG: hypothetical protein K1W24_02695 [Lachnospiraceae bacterium]
MKYNKSAIMKRAWTIKKSNPQNIFGLCLKMAWAETKEIIEVEVKITKEHLIEKLEEKRAYAAERYSRFLYFAHANDWQSYGKDRTYFVVYEKSNVTRHNVKIDCGYFDNIKNEYVPGRRDLTDKYDLCGRSIDY